MSTNPNEMTSSSSRMLRAWKARWNPGGMASPGSQARRNCSHAPGLGRRAENMTIMSAPQSTDMGSVWRSPAGSMVTAARSVRRQRSRSFPKPTRVTWQSLRAIACSRENSARHMERWCRAHGRSEVDVRVWRVRHRQSVLRAPFLQGNRRLLARRRRLQGRLQGSLGDRPRPDR